MRMQRIFDPSELIELSVRCSYCGEYAELISSDKMFSNSPSYPNKFFYRCVPCNAYVPCYEGTKTPMGRLADRDLRKAISDAKRAYYDVINFKIRNGTSKQSAFRSTKIWLAHKLHIPTEGLNFNMMTHDECLRAETFCKNYIWYGKE